MQWARAEEAGGYYSVLAGVGIFGFKTAPSFAVANCNRGLFYGSCLYQSAEWLFCNEGLEDRSFKNLRSQPETA
jgi:hypothetical protein